MKKISELFELPFSIVREKGTLTGVLYNRVLEDANGKPLTIDSIELVRDTLNRDDMFDELVEQVYDILRSNYLRHALNCEFITNYKERKCTCGVHEKTQKLKFLLDGIKEMK